MNHRRHSQSGQAMLLFAFALPIMLGFLAFVLDAGVSYFIAKRAQAAMDAAALAAVSQALEQVGPAGNVSCGSVNCQAATNCPSSGNLETGCQYAKANGFATGGSSGSQAVTMAADASSNAPGAPGVDVDYWVQAKAKQSMPQWFSVLFASRGLTPSASAVAALRRADLNASMYLLNRSTDCFVSALNAGLVCGENFLALGTNKVSARGGIYMASSNGLGLGLPSIAAGTVVAGGVTVDAPFTNVMGGGQIQNIIAGTQWDSAPANGFPDGSQFSDPMSGRGQPPLPTGLADRPVPGGVIVGSLFSNNPVVLPPGNYYSTLPLPSPLGLRVATGLPVVVTGHVVFSDGQNPPCGGFCNYVFYGGLVTGALSSVTVAPGRYVFAGAQTVAGAPATAITMGVNSTLKDLTPLVNGAITPNSDAGEIFIFTDSHHPGLTLPGDLSRAGLSFPHARAGVAAGVNPVITLHGLNRNASALPADLQPFAPALIWQDQANTTLKYTPSGRVDLSCGGPCENILQVPGSQQMILAASQRNGKPGVNLHGIIYGPRGSWLTILGLLPGDTVAGPLQVITGALQLGLFASLDMQPLTNPATRLVATLIR